MIRNIGGLLALVVLASCSFGGMPTFPPDTKLYILRHADRDGPDLNDLGRARAEALVVALANEELDAIYTIGIPRNLDSAAPLAEARGLEVQVIPAVNIAERLLAAIPGERAVWIGNSGNLREIWEVIEAPEPPPVEYGDLFVVTRMGGALEIERRRFGP